MAFKYPAVSWHGVACFKDDDIADNEVFTPDGLDLSVSDDTARRGGHFHERFHRGFGFGLLDEGHDRVDDDND